jgi:hypothetical protein
MPSPPEHAKKIQSIIASAFTLFMVVEATKLGIPDLLADGPKTAEELARKTGTMADPLRRLMRALAANEVFVEREDGSFESTDASELLREGPTGLMRNLVLMLGGGSQLQAWLALDHSIRTGERAFDHVFGKPLFDYFAEHPDEGALFNEAMTRNTMLLASLVPSLYDFGRFTKLIDVGGGHGELMIAILKVYPELRGAVFDLPEVVPGARSRLEAAGLTDRCETSPGSFFEAVPTGADAIIMKAIIHDWDDERSTVILRNCRKALPDDGTLLLVDRIMPERITPGFENVSGTFMDLNMLVNPGGRERTELETDRLLAGAGFKLGSTGHVARGIYLIEALPT